ncbi:hypothetical protein QUF75_02660 [Desulfococcaceae bacterium HSG7]|nr:hypothetical protein [Desulfococcaceae bacterium HSG7]
MSKTKRKFYVLFTRSVLKNCSLLIISTVLSLFVIEIYLHFFDNYRGQQIKVINGKKIDHRDKSRALYDLLADGKKAYPAVYPTVFMQSLKPNKATNLLPISGISRMLTAFCNELDQFIIYRSDRYGFNNDDNVWDLNPQILIIGDSFAHGACVPQESTIATNITLHFKPAVNLGMNANGPLLEFVGLVEYGSSLKPEIVLWLYFEGNDLKNLSQEIAYVELRNYLKPGYKQGLIMKQEEINSQLIEFVEKTKEYQSIKQNAKTASDFNCIVRFRSTRAKISRLLFRKDQKKIVRKEAAFKPNEHDLSLFADIIRRSRNLVTSWNGTLHFVYIPQWERYRQSQKANIYRHEVIKAVNALGIPVIDVHAIFKTLAAPATMYAYPSRGGHFTVEGYQIVSRYIITHLKKH